MRIGVILPHLKRFGGVRRFIEVGNELIERGHDVTVFCGEEEVARDEMGVTTRKFPEPGFPFNGDFGGWDQIDADILLIGDPPSFPALDQAKGKVYVWVIAGGQYEEAYRKLYATGEHKFLVNNRVYQEVYPESRLVEGGVNTKTFRRKQSLIRVGYNARGRIKGSDLIYEALGDLHDHIELIPMSAVETDELLSTFYYPSLDYYVCWEQREGWPNMAAEALACGVPVVSNGLNTAPFNDRVIVVDDLREFFTNPMGDFSWSKVVDRLVEVWKEDGVYVSNSQEVSRPGKTSDHRGGEQGAPVLHR